MTDLCFVDVETTGLDPMRHELIEVAAIRATWSGLRPLRVVTRKIRPLRIEEAEPEALEVNGYSAERWADAVTLEEGLLAMAPLLEGAIPAGHNVAFDLGFLVRGYAEAGLGAPKMDHHQIDTSTLSWLLAQEGESLSLRATCERLGIDQPEAHRALADAWSALEVARRVRRGVGQGLTLAEASELLRVSRKTAYTMARSGELPAFKVGEQWRVRPADLDRWIGDQITANALRREGGELSREVRRVCDALRGVPSGSLSTGSES